MRQSGVRIRWLAAAARRRPSATALAIGAASRHRPSHHRLRQLAPTTRSTAATSTPTTIHRRNQHPDYPGHRRGRHPSYPSHRRNQHPGHPSHRRDQHPGHPSHRRPPEPLTTRHGNRCIPAGYPTHPTTIAARNVTAQSRVPQGHQCNTYRAITCKSRIEMKRSLAGSDLQKCRPRTAVSASCPSVSLTTTAFGSLTASLIMVSFHVQLRDGPLTH
jgi:hypothetical protein